jgi:hypothetical protein
MIDKLIVLADKLDNAGHKKVANVIDRVVIAARLEDYDDLTKLFSGKLDLRDTDENVPLMRSLVDVPEDYELPAPSDEDLRPEEDARLERKMRGADISDLDVPGAETIEDLELVDRKPARLDELKRRHELMKLKKLLNDEEVVKEEVEEAPESKDEKTSISPEDKEKLEQMKKLFEEEDEDENVVDLDMNNASDDEDDNEDIVAEIEMKLKNAPELVKKLIQMLKANPEILDEIAF